MSGLNDTDVQRPLDDQHEGGAPAAPPGLPGDAGIDLDRLVAAYGRLAEEIEANGLQSDLALDKLGRAVMQTAWVLHKDPMAWKQLKKAVDGRRMTIPLKASKKTLTLLRYLEALRPTDAKLEQREHLRLTKRLSRIAIAMDRARITSSSSEEAEAKLRDKGIVCLSREAAKKRDKPATAAVIEAAGGQGADPVENQNAAVGGRPIHPGFFVRLVEIPLEMDAKLDSLGTVEPVRLVRTVDGAGQAVIQASPCGDLELQDVQASLPALLAAVKLGPTYSPQGENQEQCSAAAIGFCEQAWSEKLSTPETSTPPLGTPGSTAQEGSLPSAGSPTIPPAPVAEARAQPMPEHTGLSLLQPVFVDPWPKDEAAPPKVMPRPAKRSPPPRGASRPPQVIRRPRPG